MKLLQLFFGPEMSYLVLDLLFLVRESVVLMYCGCVVLLRCFALLQCPACVLSRWIHNNTFQSHHNAATSHHNSRVRHHTEQVNVINDDIINMNNG